MALEKYRAKRNFKITPEPRGKLARKASQELAFVIQKHAASHLHYDFRLELNGVLLSWAVPKGPSLDPADKRLAMHVEDHPIEYGEFEGVIPAKQYGGGTVMLWDRGTWHPEGDPAAAYAKGHLKFELAGKKLHGAWTLLRTQGSKYGGKDGKQAWLLIKARDDFAEADGPSIVESAPDSVASGRSIEEIAAQRSHVWESKLSVQENVRSGAIARAKSASRSSKRTKTAKETSANAEIPPGAKKATISPLLSPMLTTLVAEAPNGDDWLHEIKYDGYRLLCRIENKKARLYTRNGNDWTSTFPGVADDLARVPVKTAWIDGEACVLDSEGRSSFQALQNALSRPHSKISFFAFDLLYRDGYDLRKVVLTERKRLLREIIGDGVGVVQVGPEVRGHGEEFFKQACKLSLEGTICKRAGSLYQDGVRTREWVKVKCTKRQEMVIGGYTEPQGSRTGFGALLLGVYEGAKFRYAGKVGTGFNEKTLKEIYRLLVQREQDKPPFFNPPRGYEAKGAHWVKPDLVAEIEFTEWSEAGALRHPSFQGLRADKNAVDVVREAPKPLPAAIEAGDSNMRVESSKPSKTKRAASEAASKSRTATVPTPSSSKKPAPITIAGISISNPDKLYFPDEGITKADVVRYYESIAPRIIPHIKGRPLSLVRCPDGWNAQCFYQKHADKAVNAAVDRIEAPEGNGTATYMGAASATALVALVQWGVIEMHPWGSRVPRLDRPDRLIFDLDPADDIPWQDLVTAVQLLRTLLGELKLEGFLKTTGGKGLHVVVPIKTTLDWEQAKGFTRAVADFMVRTFGDRFTATASKEKRKGKIFIDYLRNAEGATAIAPYGVRARAGAPVSMPIAWEELKGDVRFDHFNLRNAADRLSAQKRDPWLDFDKRKQSIGKAQAKPVGFSL